ncbi:MAG: hypothetical protein EOO11_04735 [Chitinophagaceae bacterium]|nr:MAG: hypothetical protein EOO11_04735 [Chitinophagaceae bacterium]
MLFIKAGELLAYKVKPFTRHVVSISEKGNSQETEKKVALVVGKLVVQGVPIEIKISMPDIEGVDNNQKSRDEWIADKLPIGRYEINFAFNQKKIQCAVEIRERTETVSL